MARCAACESGRGGAAAPSSGAQRLLAEDLEYPFAEAPEAGTHREVAPGVHWLRMPLPMAGLDHINLWLLADDGGWTIVDTGLRNTRIRELWERIFATGLAGRPVRRIIVTHFHPDHLGQAGWLCARWGVPLWITRTEWLFGRMLQLDEQEVPPESVITFYRQVGFSEQMLEMLRERGYGHYNKGVTRIPEAYRRIADGERIDIGGRAWQVVTGRGHAPEHACLYCAELGVMISGDHVLPKISPHIGVYPAEPEANPLQEYLTSLPRFYELPPETLILPAHKEPFVGLHRRIDGLIRHHRERLERLRNACAEPKSVLDTLPILFKRALGPFETFLACGESIAHLNHLIAEEVLVREVDGDGVARYRRADPAADAA